MGIHLSVLLLQNYNMAKLILCKGFGYSPGFKGVNQKD